MVEVMVEGARVEVMVETGEEMVEAEMAAGWEEETVGGAMEAGMVAATVEAGMAAELVEVRVVVTGEEEKEEVQEVATEVGVREAAWVEDMVAAKRAGNPGVAAREAEEQVAAETASWVAMEVADSMAADDLAGVAAMAAAGAVPGRADTNISIYPAHLALYMEEGL